MPVNKKKYATGWKTIPLEKLKKAEWNYKTDDEPVMEKLVANLSKNDQVENIIVRPINDDCSEFEVVNGNHRVDAFLKLGKKEVFCFDLGVVSDAHAKRIAVETNETRFPINPARLSEIVSSLVDESGVDDILRSIPFSKDQVEGMQILSNAKPKKEEKKDSFETAYYVICEKCGEKHYTDEYGNPLESE